MVEQKPKILIIDDDPHILKLVEFYLEKDMYRIIGANNGKAAITALTKENFDLIVVDMLMPQMDGLTFIKEIRDELNLDCPVILATAQEPTDKIMNIVNEYAYDMIQKPFTSYRLRLTVRNALKYKDLLEKFNRLKRKKVETN